MVIAVNVIPYEKWYLEVPDKQGEKKGTHDERGNNFQKDVLCVVIGSVERYQKNLYKELEGSRFDQNTNNRKKVGLLGSERCRLSIRFPDLVCHAPRSQSGLNHSYGIES